MLDFRIHMINSDFESDQTVAHYVVNLSVSPLLPDA